MNQGCSHLSRLEMPSVYNQQENEGLGPVLKELNSANNQNEQEMDSLLESSERITVLLTPSF